MSSRSTPPPCYRHRAAGRIVPSHCRTCRSCAECKCICKKCLGCNTKVPDSRSTWCRTCLRCTGCHACRNKPRFIAMTPHGSRTTRVNPLPRMIGLELEIGEWFNLMEQPFRYLRFEQTHDWSVKPSEREMVILPMRGDGYLRGVIELATNLATSGAVLNESCAYHVHIEAIDYSYWEIRRFLTLYERLEPELYQHLIAPHRRNLPESLHYCQMMTDVHETCDRCVRYDSQYPGKRILPEPLHVVLARMNRAKSTGDLKDCLLRMLYHLESPTVASAAATTRGIPREIDTRKGGRFEYARYFGVNFHSWMYRGTIEFRMKEATPDPSEMIHFPLWCGWMVHAVTRMSDADAASVTSIRDFTSRYMPGYLLDYVRSRGC